MSVRHDPVWQKLHARYRERLQRELPLLQAYQPATAKNLTEQSGFALCQLAHGLAGSGGTFGFPEISATALVLEESILKGQSLANIDHALATLINTITGTLQNSEPTNPV